MRRIILVVAGLALATLVIGVENGAILCDVSASPESWQWCVAIVEDGATAPVSVLDSTPLLDVLLLGGLTVLSRIGLVGLLEERNYAIARNIRRVCLERWWAGEDACTVVAVLGLAHVNGVCALLKGRFDVDFVCDPATDARVDDESAAGRRTASRRDDGPLRLERRGREIR